MEIIGKGKTKGAVWVASKVPDGHICSHANQARTRTFALDDPTNVRYAKDVVTFAQVGTTSWPPHDRPRPTLGPPSRATLAPPTQHHPNAALVPL